MKALVTGSAGFVGRHLCPKLESAGYCVHNLDPLFRGASQTVDELTRQTVDELTGNVPVSPYDLIVHLAANIVNVEARMKMGLSAYDDLALDLEFLKWVEKNPPRKALVLMSSCAVDFPDDPYCIVKRNLEAMAKTLAKRGAPVIVLRPFSGYGQDQSEEYPFRAILERALRKEDPLTVWGGDQVRDWIHIDDLTDAILFAIENETIPRDATPIEVGTCIGTSLHELAYRIARNVGYTPRLWCDGSKAISAKSRIAGQSVAVSTLQSYGWRPTVLLEGAIRRAVTAVIGIHTVAL